MKSISAHVTGFYHASFHAYTTEVSVDGHRWRLGLRYSKFHEFYDQLLLRDKTFHAEFPPKGTLFFSPKPEERQDQLESFLQHVLDHFAMRGHPADIEELLCDLLKVPRHLRSPEHEDDNVSTSTESVLDEPMHEPPSSSDSFGSEAEQAEHKKALQSVEAEAKDAAASEAAEQDDEPAAAKKVETVATPELVQSPVVEARPVEEAETTIAHEDAVTIVETPAPAGQEEVAEVENEKSDAVMEQEIEKEEQPEKEQVVETVELADTEEVAIAEQVAEKTEPADTEEVLIAEQVAAVPPEKAAAEVVAELKAEKPEVALPEQPVTGPVAKPVAQVEEAPAPPQPPFAKTLADPVVDAAPKEEAVAEEKELAVSGGASSWLAAYLPKSLLAFVRRRCLKKTSLVVLCVALLLPMVLARR
ncbi:unnamed protein product [Phytophthora fragariaefolia]|uniref:Unnamed protein product n=1 Tax=Phytophthora fragariaefolia TaxID=1490495 RepID=A0A9W6UAK5_9STRA|nr:unnamed protein product [Phytophthora fragariaefolia]